MNENEKIKISWDEVVKIGDVKQASPMVVIVEHPSDTTSPTINRAWISWALGSIGILFLIIMTVIGLRQHRDILTVEGWIKKETVELSNKLSTSSDWKSHIEDIHPFVTYRRLSISQILAKTVDGSNIAGRNGENISELDILITFYWEGPITKDGFTEVRFIYDVKGQALKSTKYERSNAAVNLATVDWFKTGAMLGILLFGG
jgi:hypothetical protein